MRKILCAVVLGGLVLAGCGGGRSRVTTIDGFAQGSTYHIVIKSDRPMDDARAGIDSVIATFDRSASLYYKGSLLERLNANETDSVDAYIAECIEVAGRLSRESDGLYDITVKPLVAAWGFAGEERTERPDVDSLLQYVGYEKIRLENGRLVKSDPNVQIDLNSIAQGYTADILGRYIESLGVTDYLVEIGGEIFCRGINPDGREWVVGIDKPVEGNFTPGADLQVKLGISNEGLATSGNYRKFYTDGQGRKIVHTIDPRTGMSAESSLLAATVVAPTAILADAYGTMFMVMGLERSREFLAGRPDVQAYLVYADSAGNFRTYVTPALARTIVK